jgi:phenylalanyl-tRNA synthetase alpha chain
MAAGMIGPQVFKNVNINPEIYSGFAFGLEVDRLAGLLYDIPAPSSLYENDIRLIRTLSRKS